MSHILQRIEREMKNRKRSRGQVMARRVSIVFLSVAIPLVAAELILRLAGYSRPQIDFAAQENSLREATASLNERFGGGAFEYDSHLFWKLKPGANLGGLDVGENGLLTWPMTQEATTWQATPFTVLCLGDSVTALTYRTYPQIAEQLAMAGAGSRNFRFLNGAVPGYSTEQALRYLPSLKSLRPHVVILCFGWNDHFPALNLPDKELGASSSITSHLHDLLKDLRLYQLVGAPLGWEGNGKEQHGEGDSRVSPEQFRENLDKLVEVVRSWNALPVLATEPQNLKSAAEDFLEQNAFIAPGGRNNEGLHGAYNQIIRDVAVAAKVPLMDIDEEFIRRPRDYMLEPDGIHLTGRGHNHVARLVLGMLKNEGLMTTGDYNAVAQAEKHDTTAPDKPRITWNLSPGAVSEAADQPFQFSIIPQNSGNTRWLKKNMLSRFGEESNISYGSASVYARWRTVDSPTTDIVQRMPVPSDILPGEATSVTMMLKAPAKPGNYELEIGMMADRVGPLSLYGAETTTLTVTTLPTP